jgi:hypothetical protein
VGECGHHAIDVDWAAFEDAEEEFALADEQAGDAGGGVADTGGLDAVKQ